jgi:hypothetical protein
VIIGQLQLHIAPHPIDTTFPFDPASLGKIVKWHVRSKSLARHRPASARPTLSPVGGGLSGMRLIAGISRIEMSLLGSGDDEFRLSGHRSGVRFRETILNAAQ